MNFSSILDCLIDDDPKIDIESCKTIPEAIHALKASIIQNIRNILMTQRFNLPDQTTFSELVPSLLDYGLPDYISYSLNKQKTQKLLADFIKSALHNYETRIQLTEIIPIERFVNNFHTLSFSLKGVIATVASDDLFEFIIDIDACNQSVSLESF